MNEYIKNLIIYDINMDKIKDIWYSKSKNEIEKYKYLIMLDLNQEELKTLEELSQDRSVDKYMKTIEEVNQNPDFREFMSAEEDNRKIENSLRREAIEKGLAEGLEQGSLAEKQNIAKAMLNDNLDVSTISKYTGLGEEEIKTLK